MSYDNEQFFPSRADDSGEHTCPCSCLCFCEGVESYPDLGCTTPCPDFDSPHAPHGASEGGAA